MAAEVHRLADGARPAAECARPVSVADDDHGMPARPAVVLDGERPAQARPQAERREVVAGDDLSDARLGVAAASDRQRHEAEGRKLLERAAPVAVLEIVRVRDRPDLLAGPGLAEQPHETVAVVERQRLQERLVDQAEHGRVDADRQGEREDGGGRERRGLCQDADRVADVLEECAH